MRILWLILLAAAAHAQDHTLLYQQDFETGAGRWSALGTGSVHATRDPEATFTKHGSLAFDYEVKPRQIAAAVLPTPMDLSRLTHIRFFLKTGRDAPMAVLLSERKPGGGNYTAAFFAPKGEWQRIELTPRDFVLSEGPADPKDADGKLDLDQIEGIAVLDLGSFLAAAPGLKSAAPQGRHTFWIDHFELYADPPSARPAEAGLIDAFNRGFLQWIPLGPIAPTGPVENPLHEQAVEIRYSAFGEAAPLIARQLANFDLAKATRIGFDIASEQATTIGISLELRNPGAAQGPRFNLPIYPPGKREVFHVDLKLKDFEGQGTLDPARLKTILLVDASAAGGGELGKNTIWIGRLRIY